jgi:hypothetical protein
MTLGGSRLMTLPFAYLLSPIMSGTFIFHEAAEVPQGLSNDRANRPMGLPAEASS